MTEVIVKTDGPGKWIGNLWVAERKKLEAQYLHHNYQSNKDKLITAIK